MNEKLVTNSVTVLLAIISLAIVATLVSNKSDTPNVFSSLAKAFSGSIGCALSPVTGASCGESVTSSISFGM